MRELLTKLKPFGEKAARFAARPPQYDARINILWGSVRSGKTFSVIPKIAWLCRYQVEGYRVVTGVSKEAIYRNVLQDLFEIAGNSHYTYNRQSGELTLWGSRWVVIGARDEGSEKAIRGMTIGAAVPDELSLMPRTFFQMLHSRMSPEGARMYATTNPDSPYHWIKTDILDNPDLRHGLGADVWGEHFTLDDNPHLSEEYKAVVRRSYTGVFYRRFILGEWVMAEGAIYKDALSDNTWYSDEQRPPGLRSRHGHMEHAIAVDYGTTNPMVYGDIYDDGRTVWMDAEYYWDSKEQQRQKTDAEYANDLINGCPAMGWPGFPKSERDWPSVIIDPSAASFKAELSARGVHVVDADNDVHDGIRRVSTMFASNRLKIHRSCTHTRKDIENYSWNEKKTDKGQEQPLKVHDHGADMLKYYVQTRINDWRLASG